MDILFYGYQDNAQTWLEVLSAYIPEARLRIWQEGDDAAADYAIVRNPPIPVLKPRPALKAVFSLGAGVDTVLATAQAAMLPADVPLIRLDDAGMGAQMADYVHHAVMRFFRDFDRYEQMQAAGQWLPLPPRHKETFTVGIMGLGVLGTHIAEVLSAQGFPVHGWSRTHKHIDGITSYAGAAEWERFLAPLSVLVNMLPLTPETTNILSRNVFDKLPRGAYVINVARGAHLVEDDLLSAIASGHLAGARLDVCRTEPLPAGHPFWREPRISITPHISANVMLEDSIRQIAGKIRAMEAGQDVAGIVDRVLGY